MRTQTGLLIRYLRPRWPTLFLLLLALCGSTALRLVVPRVVGSFIDQALNGAGISLLVTLALAYFALGAGLQLLSLAGTYLGQNLAWQATNDLRGDLFEHVLRLGLPFHNRRTPGELIQRIDGDVSALSGFLSQFSVMITGNFLMLIGTLGVLFWTDWRIGLLFLLFTLVTFTVFHVTRSMAVPAQKQRAETQAQLMGYIEEHLGGVADIRSNGASEYVMQGLYRLGRVRLRTLVKSYLMYSLRWSIAHATFTVGTLFALGAGALLFLQGKITLGTVYLIYSYTDLLLTPLQEISAQLQDLQKATAGAERALELLTMEPEHQANPGTATLPQGPLDLELCNLTFSYGASSPALDDINLHLEPGQSLGVIGRTGSGKSTLAKLLLRFYDPSSGEIRIAGQDLRQIDPQVLHSRVALVAQEVQLFQASVRDNVTLFDPSIPDSRIVWALEEVGLGGWLRAQPDGLDTKLGSGGAGLSSGQGQLVAFARVLLRDPGLLVLDEASSHLDPATEQVLDGAMSRLLQGRTAILVAHRLATLDRVDQILVLEAGRVVEYGPRRALAADPETHYARLLRVGMEDVLV